MKPTKLIKSKVNPTLFLCACGQQVLEAYFDELGYLHTSGVEYCPKCGRTIDEDLLDENEVEVKDTSIGIDSADIIEWEKRCKNMGNVFFAVEKD